MASYILRSTVISSSKGKSDILCHVRRTGLSVGVWQEEEGEEEESEEEEENSTSNLSLVLEMLMPGRAIQELEVGRLLTNLSR